MRRVVAATPSDAAGGVRLAITIIVAIGLVVGAVAIVYAAATS